MFPEKGYQGKYIEKFAEDLKEEFGDLWVREVDFSYFNEDSEAILDHFIQLAKAGLGAEYELLNKIFESNTYKKIGSIYFEDHSRKIFSSRFFDLKSKVITR